MSSPSRYEVELTLTSAKDLKNVNWRHGKLKPYAVVWVDPNRKFSTRVDEEGDTSPRWDQTLVIPFDSALEDSTLQIDVVQADAKERTKPLIGSAKIGLDEVGLASRADRKLELKRPSGRPQGKIEVKINVHEPNYCAPPPYYAPPPYGVPPPPGSRDYAAPPLPYGDPYGAPPAYAAAPSGYPSYGQPAYGQQYAGYGQASYGQPQPAYGQSNYYGQAQQGYVDEKKKSKFGGIGTGLAVGAVAGVLGGLAIAEGVDALEDKIEDDVADRVEEDLGYDGDDY